MKGAEVDLEEQIRQPSNLELRVGQEGEGLARLEPYFCRQPAALRPWPPITEVLLGPSPQATCLPPSLSPTTWAD